MKRLVGVIFSIAILSESIWAQCPADRVIKGEYLVRLRSESAPGSAKVTWKALQAKDTYLEPLRQKKVSKVLSKTIDSQEVETYFLRSHGETFADHPDVVSIEPNCEMDLFKTPNDSRFAEQWAHKTIKSEEAWNISSGTPEVIVAVSDTGVDYLHEDLQSRMWVNLKEKTGQPGVDDDDNGCIDDIYGCDFGEQDGDPMPGTSSGAEHGTHVAGIIGAIGDNRVGIAGVVWNVKIMAVKGFGDDAARADLASLLKTVYYAADNGAHVLNCSWGAAMTPTKAERDAFAYARNKGVLAIVAAGNSAEDAKDYSPAALDNVITVASSNSQDHLSAFSNYGNAIDIMAPGGDSEAMGGLDESILSTVPRNAGSYAGLQGTSMAAPYVAGVAALIWSINRQLSLTEVQSILLSATDPIFVSVPRRPSLSFTYKRLNASKAAQQAQATLPTPPASERPGSCTGSTVCDLSGLNPLVDSSFKDGLVSSFGGCGQMKAAELEEADEAQLPWSGLLFILPTLMILYYRKSY